MCGGDGGDRYLYALCKGAGEVTEEVAEIWKVRTGNEIVRILERKAMYPERRAMTDIQGKKHL